MASRAHVLWSPAALVLGAATVPVVVIAISVVGSPAAATVREQLVTAKRGVVQTTVSGTGSLSPANQANVDFGTSGTVTVIRAKVGQHVSAGEVLAEVDPSAAEVALTKAKADLQSAQDTLTSAETAAASSTSTTATAAATAATTATASLLATVATATPPAAPSSPSATPKSTTTTPAPSAGSGSSGNSGKSGSSGNSSGSGAAGSTISVASAQAAVDSAQLTLRNAETALEQTRLHAPIGGTVAAINGQVGDTVGGGSSSSSAGAGGGGGAGAGGGGSGSSSSSSSSGFIVLAQLSHFKMDVSLTESDIGKVKVGQAATVTVNAAEGEQFAAHVTSIGVLAASGSSGTSSAVSYPVSLTLDQTGSRLKAGMSASADIITAQESGVSVPNQALEGSTVTVVRNGKRIRQDVQTGTAGDSSTIIASGLSAGEQVLVTSRSATAGAAAAGGAAAGANGAGRRFGPGGFGGGGVGQVFRGGGGGGPAPAGGKP
jgi:multidrug efflux pump subunit AcrA (membrane-fusion protein)